MIGTLSWCLPASTPSKLAVYRGSARVLDPDHLRGLLDGDAAVVQVQDSQQRVAFFVADDLVAADGQVTSLDSYLIKVHNYTNITNADIPT